jgi:four helix bundle protein
MNNNRTKPHKRLEVWNKSVDLCVEIYRLSEMFPKTEMYGLSNQMRRAAVSVPSNIAEGAARQTKKEFMNFLHISQGSLSELDTQVIIANRLNYVTDQSYQKTCEKIETISKMITGLIKSLKENPGNKVRNV